MANETPRFVVEAEGSRYKVVDLTNNKSVKYSYVPTGKEKVLYGEERWNNYYAARGFCQKLYSQVNKQTNIDG